jgi:hypothetical protein
MRTQTGQTIGSAIGVVGICSLGAGVAFAFLPPERGFLALPVPFLIAIGVWLFTILRGDHKRPDISRGNTLCGYGIVAFLWIMAVMFVGFLFVPVQ